MTSLLTRLCLFSYEFLMSCLYVKLLPPHYFMQKWVIFFKKIAVVTLMLLVFAESSEIMETLAQIWLRADVSNFFNDNLSHQLN